MRFHTKTITVSNFQLQCGFIFSRPSACYTLYGDLENGKKIALFFHGFSSNSELHTWWEKFKFGKISESYNIICINSLGSSYGSVGPESLNPITKEPYLHQFPEINVQDTVNFALKVIECLSIERFDLVFGCSLGGMQALDMFLRYPQIATKFISVAGTPVPYMTKLTNLAQARIIGKAIRGGNKTDIQEALGLSRFFFRLSCTTEDALQVLIDKRNKVNNKKHLNTLETYFVEDNLRFQTLFSPYSNSLYLKLIADFELHDISLHKNPSNLSELILVSIENDLFTPVNGIEALFDNLKKNGFNASLREFKTKFGHEAWIVDGARFYEFIEKDLFI